MAKIFEGVSEKVVELIDNILFETSNMVADLARNYVPVVTGRLRGSIRVRKGGGKERGVVEYIVSAGGEEAPYAAFVEFGIGEYGAQSVSRYPQAVELMDIVGYRHGTGRRGFPGRFYMTRAWVHGTADLEKRLDDAVREVFRRR